MNSETRFDLFLSLVHPFKNRGLGRITFLNSLYRHAEGRLLPKTRKTIRINNYDIQLEITSIDGIARLLIYNGEYESVTTSVLKKYLTPSMKCVDVGANIGYYTLLMARNSEVVWAFEPEEKNYKDLLENIKLNHFQNIIPINRAVGAIGEVKNLYVSSEESGEHSLVSKRHCKSTTKVEVVTLDSMIKQRIDVVKIDTEGYDFNVLLGAKRLLSTHPLLITEFWPEGINLCGHSCKEFWDLLSTYYPVIYIADEVEKTLTVGSMEDAIRRIGKNMMSVNLIGGLE